MPKYLGRARYLPEGLRALREAGAVNRREVTARMVAGIGGTQEAWYGAFDEWDVFAVLDLPDDRAAAALSVTINASGVVEGRITKLLTAEELDEAFAVEVGYTPPSS